MYNILSLTDTLAMINAALSSEKLKKTDEAFKYYKMGADNNYGKGAEMYQSMIRVLNANDTKDEEQILNIIAEGKERYPKDYVLNIEEFNYWYTKGNNEKAQLALENAIESNPTNKILHFIFRSIFERRKEIQYNNIPKTQKFLQGKQILFFFETQNENRSSEEIFYKFYTNNCNQ